MEVSGDYYTQEEIREVVQYAKLRGVEIVPEIDVPGHVSAILAAYPQYSCSGRQVKVAKCGGIYPVILCAGKEDVYIFLEELFEEVFPLFNQTGSISEEMRLRKWNGRNARTVRQ